MRTLPYRAGIHIGLPKCGSTSLQRRMQETDPRNYLGKLSNAGGVQFTTAPLHRHLREELPYAPAAAFDPGLLAATVRRAVEEGGCDVHRLMLSDELLCGFGFLNFPRRRQVDPATIFARLAPLFARPRLLIVIRSQLPFLKSYYAQLLKHGYNAFFDRFLQSQLQAGLGLSVLLRYDRYLALAERYFDDVTMVPLEALSAETPAALEALERFGIDGRGLARANPSPQPPELLALLAGNLRAPRDFGLHTPLGDVAGLRALEQRTKRHGNPVFLVPEGLLGRWRELAAEGNRALRARSAWPLEAYGYPL